MSGHSDRILRVIEQSVQDRGYPPTVREICRALNIPSTATVHKVLQRMVYEGIIEIDPGPRAIRIVRGTTPTETV